jgi:ABC-2 type transport system ATP-binding protein
VITESHTGRQSTFLVRSTAPMHDPAWAADSIDLEDLVLAYMGAASSARPALEETR